MPLSRGKSVYRMSRATVRWFISVHLIPVPNLVLLAEVLFQGLELDPEREEKRGYAEQTRGAALKITAQT